MLWHTRQPERVRLAQCTFGRWRANLGWCPCRCRLGRAFCALWGPCAVGPIACILAAHLSAFLLAVDWLSCGLAHQRTIAVEPVWASVSASAPQWLTNATLAKLGRRAGLWMERAGNLERNTVGRLHTEHVPREGQGKRQSKGRCGEGGRLMEAAPSRLAEGAWMVHGLWMEGVCGCSADGAYSLWKAGMSISA